MSWERRKKIWAQAYRTIQRIVDCVTVFIDSSSLAMGFKSCFRLSVFMFKSSVPTQLKMTVGLLRNIILHIFSKHHTCDRDVQCNTFSKKKFSKIIYINETYFCLTRRLRLRWATCCHLKDLNMVNSHFLRLETVRKTEWNRSICHLTHPFSIGISLSLILLACISLFVKHLLFRSIRQKGGKKISNCLSYFFLKDQWAFVLSDGCTAQNTKLRIAPRPWTNLAKKRAPRPSAETVSKPLCTIT